MTDVERLRMTKAEKLAAGFVLMEAIESNDNKRIADAVTAEVMKNNPDYADLAPVVSMGLAGVLNKLGGGVGGGLSRLLPWNWF